MSTIKILSDKTINQIAAGEVIERPVSVVKELVENAIDAGATKIVIRLERGGRNQISVTDNGCGMARTELDIAVQRHATSKLKEDDISNITSYGFRGEALPSIGSVAKMRIISRHQGAAAAYEIAVNGGQVTAIKPAAHPEGTTIEVREIFAYTPVRLKFLKSESSEKTATLDLIHKIALANPEIGFKIIYDDKIIFDCKPKEKLQDRVKLIMGKEFYEQSLYVDNTFDELTISGYIGRPTYGFSNNSRQYTFVNQRVVKDKLLLHSIKSAYQNLIPDGRYAAVVLFLKLEPYAVDVNVHPAKVEVRFREEQKIRSAIIASIREALRKPISESTATTQSIPLTWQQHRLSKQEISMAKEIYSPKFTAPSIAQNLQNPDNDCSDKIGSSEISGKFKASLPESSVTAANEHSREKYEVADRATKIPLQTALLAQQTLMADHPLGEARCQIGDLYIVAENKDGIVIVDQHAAHERIVLENMKQQLAENKVRSQALLVPEVVELGQVRVDKLLQYRDELAKLGLVIDRNGLTQIIVSQVPIVFNNHSVKGVVVELADYAYEHDNIDIIGNKAEEILGNFACHYSVRAGRKLSVPEMNAILRDVENTPNAGQCNHGRPTYIKLDKNKLAALFER